MENQTKNELREFSRNVYHIVLGIHDETGTYVLQMAATMQSIIENTKNKLVFHIFTDADLKEDSRIKLQMLVSDNGHRIRFYDVDIPTKCRQSNAMKYLSIGALYRLYIVNLIDGVDRVLYLDCDMIVTLDIKQIFDTFSGNHAIAAVRDAKCSWIYTKGTSIKKDKYFNTGLILFNLNKIKTEYNLFDDAMDFLDRHPRSFGGDQAPMNYIFQNDCMFLPEKFNRFPTKENDDISASCIWHFAGGKGNKPWLTKAFNVSGLYWHYLFNTPWGKNKKMIDQKRSKLVIPLEDALAEYPIGSRKLFLKSILARLRQECKIYWSFFLR